MFTCAWCKGETKETVWTDDKEPICADKCFNKYQFGKSEGLITGSISDLSAAERGQISERFNTLVRFKSTAHAIRKEVLHGTYKKLKTIGSTLIFLVVFSSQLVLTSRFGILERAEYSASSFFIFGASLVLALVIVVYLQKWFAWFLCIRQMARDAGIRQQGL